MHAYVGVGWLVRTETVCLKMVEEGETCVIGMGTAQPLKLPKSPTGTPCERARTEVRCVVHALCLRGSMRRTQFVCMRMHSRTRRTRRAEKSECLSAYLPARRPPARPPASLARSLARVPGAP